MHAVTLAIALHDEEIVQERTLSVAFLQILVRGDRTQFTDIFLHIGGKLLVTRHEQTGRYIGSVDGEHTVLDVEVYQRHHIL